MTAHLPLRLARLSGVLLWLALPSSLTAGPLKVEVETRREGDAILVEAHTDLRAERALAWQVLTDYDHYAEFVPDLTYSRVVARSPDALVVEQRGLARFLFFHFPVEVRLAVIEEPFHTVRCQALSGNFKQLDGVYRLLPAAEGIRFAYSGRLVPGFHLPPIVGMAAVRASVERQFEGLVREIVRRSARRGEPDK